MSTDCSLSALYLAALSQFRQLHHDGEINDNHLALIQQHTSLDDVLSTVKEAGARNVAERNTLDRIFHKVSLQVITKIARFSAVVDVAIQSSKFSEDQKLRLLI